MTDRFLGVANNYINFTPITMPFIYNNSQIHCLGNVALHHSIIQGVMQNFRDNVKDLCLVLQYLKRNNAFRYIII